MGKSGWRNVNLRTQFERIVKHAGLKKWPRLFHNLRSSRQTELAETFPSHVVCAWLGNSEDIAKKHYYQVTDAHFAAASGQSPAPATSAPVARLLDPAGTSANFDAPVAQISTQHDAAPESTEPQNVSEPFEPTGCYALSCISLPDDAETARRTGWDSNPRAAFATAGFQDRCIQPLCHPSGRIPFHLSRRRRSRRMNAGESALRPHGAPALTPPRGFFTVSTRDPVTRGTHSPWAASATG